MDLKLCLHKQEEDDKKEDEMDDVEMHDDENFIKTLEALDEGRPAKKARVEAPEKEAPEQKPKGSEVDQSVKSGLLLRSKFLH